MPARSLSSFLETTPDFTPIEFIDIGIGAVIACLLIDRFIIYAKALLAWGKNSRKYVTEVKVVEAIVEDLKHSIEELTREVKRINEERK